VAGKTAEDFSETIDSETDRLTKLINDILDMSRIEGGALKTQTGAKPHSGSIGPYQQPAKKFSLNTTN